MEVDGSNPSGHVRSNVVDTIRTKELIELNYNHPLFLHASDTLSSMSIGIPLIGMEIYSLWCEAMQLSLLTRNKLGFVDGSINRDTFGKDYELLWDRCNAIVKSWIMNNVSRDLINGVLFRSSAHAIWEDLRERFDKVTASRMYSLHKSIFTLTQGTLPVSTYYSKLKDLWDEYDSLMPPPCCDCVKSKDYAVHLQYQRLLQFLMGLNDGYAQARSQILMKSTIPNVNQAYAMVLQDESQKIAASGGGFIKDDSPYSSSNQSGAYYFEFSRPLRTMDRLQQDAQFTIGKTSKMSVAFWYPMDGKSWHGSGHFSISCDWILLDILPDSSELTKVPHRSSWDTATAFSLLFSVVAVCISIFVGHRVSRTKNIPFTPMNSL